MTPFVEFTTKLLQALSCNKLYVICLFASVSKSDANTVARLEPTGVLSTTAAE